MDARIRYARTPDDAAIAFWEHGAGTPLLHLPWLPWGHIQLEWQDGEMRGWYDRLAEFCRLIRYDGRGSGLSDHVAKDYGIATQVADIQAVVDNLGLERFAMIASLNMGPAAITYAARYPERLSHLIFWCTYARSDDYLRSPAVAAIRSLLDSDWDLYTETGAHAFVGWSSGEAAHAVARLMREGTTRESAKRFYADMRTVDCSSLLPTITTPTLVMHPRQFPLVDIEVARSMATHIPNARFLLFEGASLTPTRGDLEGVIAAVQGFLAEGQPADATVPAHRAPLRPPGVLPDGLSPREVEVLGLLAKGLSNRDIAEALVLSPRTVERHVANIYAKTNVSNRAQAAAYAVTNDLSLPD